MEADMRGDKQWFDDVGAQCELGGKFEHIMFDMGLDVRKDAGFAAWFKFNDVSRFAYKPVWMHETFKDYGGYAAYIAEEECDSE
jgi:hypothetical protein